MKQSERISTLPTRRIKLAAGIAIVLLMTISCDNFEQDADFHEDLGLLNTEYFLASKNGIVFSLNGMATGRPLALKITGMPRLGSLNEVGDGLLRYAPDDPTESGTDWIELSSYSATNELLDRDSIYFHIESDSSKLPCGIYPAPDYVSNVVIDSPIIIEPILNDFICPQSDVQVGIFSRPRHGLATLSGNKILYTANDTFSGVDTIAYELTSTASSNHALGLIYLSNSAGNGGDCNLLAVTDTLDLSGNTIPLMQLNVLSNDVTCNGVDTLIVTELPRYGVTSVDDQTHLISYQRNQFLNDSLEYKICNSKGCSTAKAYIKQQ